MKEHVHAIIEAWNLGIEAENAVLDILFGDINPSAKLTTTFPYTSGQCPMYYANINTGRLGGKSKFTSKYLDTPLEPVYPFGYGLSYTDYKYSDLVVTKCDEKLHVTVNVKNVGKIDRKEIVQCYIRDTVVRRVRPIKQLTAFEKIEIKVDEIKKAEMDIPLDSLGYYDNNMNYIVENGEFIVWIGGNSEDCISESVIL